MAEPYRGTLTNACKETDDGKYQILNHIVQNSSNSSQSSSSDSYDYPVVVNQPFPLPPPPPHPQSTSAFNMSREGASEALVVQGEVSRRDSSNTSDSYSSGSDSQLEEPVLIRQGPTDQAGMDEGDEKLYLTGDFNCFTRTDWPGWNSDDFAEEGIYQGLGTTDTQKKNIGILPESIYMTTNLLEKGDLIESISLSFPLMDTEGPNVFFTRDTIPATDPPPPPPPKPARNRNYVEPAELETMRPRSVTPHYRELILRPPPLPPLDARANRAEKKAGAVVENLLKSEAAYLTSLNIAISVYMTPLLDMSEGPSPILSMEEVRRIFGPIENIIMFQEVFYSAITSRTLNWSLQQKIGDVLSSLSTKDVVQNYSTYVNNFTMAMSTLEKAICKKPRFVQFLKEKYAKSRTNLSLQGLLLKPVQRFPQYIMFLQDLIKFTCTSHPDRVTLQMALARFESVANFLNESKRQREQKAVVQYLNNRISRLPFKLTDAKRLLHRQDIVTRLLVSSTGNLVKKERCFLFFNNMILCASMRRKKKKGHTKTENFEGSTGSRDFQSVTDFFYICKWFCPLDQLEVVQPDYLNDVWDLACLPDANSDYSQLKEEYKKLEQDYSKMSHIMTIAASLHDNYMGLTCDDLASHVRVLQRKIAKVNEDLKAKQQGRLDIILPSRENDAKVCHTYSFVSEKIKVDWVNNLRYSKRKLYYPVENSWVIAEDVSEGDIFEVSYKLPLFVDSYSLNMNSSDVLSVQCATKVGQSCTWLATGDNISALVSIVECVTPTPIILECFRIDCRRVLDLLYVPPSSFSHSSDSTLSPLTLRKISRTIKKTGSGSLIQLPSYLATVWMGAQSGRLSIYSADSAGDGSKHCLSSIQLGDAITSLQYYERQVFVCTAEGDVVIFKRSISGFNLTDYKIVHALPGTAIRCSCKVGNKLWLGIGKICYFFNMQTHKMEGSLDTCSKEGVVISKMVNQGEGIWLSYKGSSSIELFHTISKVSLQNIDIRATLGSIIKRHKLGSRLPLPINTHVTSLMASNGYFWIGTSLGAIMVYHIPHLESVPTVSGKPYLAMDSHIGSVRVLLTMETMATPEAARVRKFLVDEEIRGNLLDDVNENDNESHDQDTIVRKRNVSEPVPCVSTATITPGGGFTSEVSLNSGVSTTTPPGGADVDQDVQDDVASEVVSTLDKSLTPTLLHPASFLEDSIVVDKEQSPAIGVTSSDEVGVVENGLTREEEEKEEEEEEREDHTVEELEMKTNGGIQSSQSVGGYEKLEVAPLKFEQSLLDSGEYALPDELDAMMDGVSSEVNTQDNGVYSNPRELGRVSFKNSMSVVKDDSAYSDPRELDTMRRISTLEVERKEGAYDFPSELVNSDGNSYEDPATLTKDPSTPLSQLFSPKVLNNSLRIHDKSLGTKEGSIFILTAGRGLLNLRQGRRASVFNHANKDVEGCMMAYEIEI